VEESIAVTTAPWQASFEPYFYLLKAANVRKVRRLQHPQKFATPVEESKDAEAEVLSPPAAEEEPKEEETTAPVTEETKEVEAEASTDPPADVEEATPS
jgi:hypothetical protein